MPKKKKNPAVSRKAAEAAVQTLLRWAGDDPDREGLRDTPRRVANAYQDWFSGYAIDPGAYLRRTYRVYRRHHVERSIAMVFKAVGLKPHSRLNIWTARLAWWSLQRRAGRLAKRAV